ncbi:hypothetical protein B0H19DRAFT_1027892 [Mycena capillaripes]|nr:hypothetical protein B0H19DRAFT_1027892 [Mycena capillaripes]
MNSRLLQELEGSSQSLSSSPSLQIQLPKPETLDGSTMANKIVIYEAVIAFLENTFRTWASRWMILCCLNSTINLSLISASRSLSEIASLQTTLEGYLQSMAAENVVNGIVASSEHRKILLELISKLGLANDLGLRTALRADEVRIAGLIMSILDSKFAKEAVLSLEGDSAQCLLDIVQDTLNRGFLMGQDHSRLARRMIRKLSESCDKLPSSLFITGVTGREEHPTFAGGFGDIYRATYGNRIVALKHMRHFIQNSELRDLRLKLGREALVWQDLHHPNILAFLGIDRESFPPSLCIVSPWMEHGTILNHLKTHGRANVDKFLYEIAQGLQYLHSRNIVHGDLRGANILITEEWSACLADFGLSVITSATTTMHTSQRAGSLYWMAPELIDPDRFGCKFVRKPASDVYAFGCVCFELYTGNPPFSQLSQAAALLKIVNGERPRRPSSSPGIPDPLWRHISAYWAEDPAMRPITEAVVQHMTWPPQDNPVDHVETLLGYDDDTSKPDTPEPSDSPAKSQGLSARVTLENIQPIPSDYQPGSSKNEPESMRFSNAAPDQVSFSKDEILDLLRKQGWRVVQQANGSVGIVPDSPLVPFIPPVSIPAEPLPVIPRPPRLNSDPALVIPIDASGGWRPPLYSSDFPALAQSPTEGLVSSSSISNSGHISPSNSSSSKSGPGELPTVFEPLITEQIQKKAEQVEERMGQKQVASIPQDVSPSEPTPRHRQIPTTVSPGHPSSNDLARSESSASLHRYVSPYSPQRALRTGPLPMATIEDHHYHPIKVAITLMPWNTYFYTVPPSYTGRITSGAVVLIQRPLIGLWTAKELIWTRDEYSFVRMEEPYRHEWVLLGFPRMCVDLPNPAEQVSVLADALSGPARR